MAPEQFEDEEHYGAAIDVYAFALLAYEIVTGKEPFNDRGKQITALNLMKKIKTDCRPEFIDGIPEKNEGFDLSMLESGSKRKTTFRDHF